SCKRVAHSDTSGLINDSLLKFDNGEAGTSTDESALGEDAYSARIVRLQGKFPSPKIAELGNLKLFSVNTNEVSALRRYRLDGAKTFPVASTLAQKMNDALLYLASEEKRGISCRAIPSTQPG